MRRIPSVLQLGHGSRRWWLWLHHRLRHFLPQPSSPSSSPPLSTNSPRFLAAACVSFGLFLLLAASLRSSVAWIMPGPPGSATVSLLFPRHQPQGGGSGSAHANGPGTTGADGGLYTVVINTWKRDDLLKRSVTHYATCPCVHAIHVVWSEPDPPSWGLRLSLSRIRPRATGSVPPVRFHVHGENSLNNRFKEMDGLATEAVFSVDDDVVLPCTALELAFQVWRAAPAVMVGFVPRMHWAARHHKPAYSYGGWLSVWWKGTYSMVLSKAAFFHAKYLSIYTNHMNASIRDYVTTNRNCEDIAMSFLVANITKAPPIWVQGRVSEIGSFGISSLAGHSERRARCLNDFAAIYGHMPLVPTTVKAVDTRQAWFW